MEGRSSAPLLVTLFAALAALYPLSLAIRAPEKNSRGQISLAPAKAESPETKNATLDFPTAKDLVSHFLFSTQGGKVGPSGAKTGEPYHIEFLIATVPDPVSSRLPYFFDSFADALESASEVAGYSLDRFALPWTQKASETGAASSWQQALYESTPGLILFRNPVDHKLLLVFLVGETPTTGIYKRALFSALDQMAQFYPWDPLHTSLPPGFPDTKSQGSSETVRVMGPAFSGSAVSLRFALDAWMSSRNLPTDLSFEIISGTATAIRPELLTQGGRGHTTFQATVPPDAETLQAVACYIDGLGYHKIAILTEGNTAYGQNLAKNFAPGTAKDDQPERGCGRTKTVPDILSLPFPLHVSRLRRASDLERFQQDQSSSGPGNRKTSSTPLAPEDAGEPREVLPSYSNLSVSSADLVLSNLLSTIAREGYSYVGIVATDVRDATFLAREVRAHCPATVLFTINSDLLYAQSDVNDVTRGLIIITPYPLFNLEQMWTYSYRGSDTRLQFSSQAAEGVYNATLALLQKSSNMVDYGHPLSPVEDGQQRGKIKPALWVTAVGHGETLPITLLDWQDNNGYTFTPDPERSGGDPKPEVAGNPNLGRGIYTEDTVVVFIALSMCLSVFSLLLVNQYARRPKGETTNWISALLGDTASPAYWSEGRLFLLCCCSSLLAFYWVVATGFCLPIMAGQLLGESFETTLTPEFAILVSLGTLLLLLGATLTLAAAFRAAPDDQRGFAPEVVLVVLLGCAFVFILAGLLVGSWFASVRRDPVSGLFNYLRSFDLRGGLSPLLPLCCVAMAAFLWALCSFRRLRLIDILCAARSTEGTHQWLNFLPLRVLSFSGIDDLEKRVIHVLESSSVMSLQWYASLIAVALLVGHYFFDTRLVRALEPRSFYWLFEAAFLIVYWALLMESLRLLLAWRSLHLLLQRLSWHPMRTAYARYRESFPGLASINLTHPPSGFAALEVSVTQAGRLLQTAKGLVEAPGTNGELRELWRQSLPEWETQVRVAECQLFEAFRFQWADNSQAHAASEKEPTRKKRAIRKPGDWREALRACGSAQYAISQFLYSMMPTLEKYWVPGQAGSPPGDLAKGDKEFFDQAEEFIVGRVVNFLALVFPSLRNLGYFVLAGLLLMLLAVTSYPFQPRNEFLFFNWVVILLFAGAVFWIFVQMDRDAILSFLNGTTPGQVNVSRELVLRTLLYVVVPVLALLGAQFPESLQRILSLFTAAQGNP